MSAEYKKSKLLRSTQDLLSPNFHNLSTNEQLLRVALLAYVKHTERCNADGFDIIGWSDLSDELHDAICEAVGDDVFVKWNEMIEKEYEKL